MGVQSLTQNGSNVLMRLCFVAFRTTMPKVKATRNRKQSKGASKKKGKRAVFVPLLQLMGDRVSDEVLQEKNWLVFERPERNSYRTPDGQSIDRYSVKVFTEDMSDFLGYVPLPAPYHDAWVCLCYNVVFFRNVYRTLMNILDNAQDTHQSYLRFIQESIQSTSAKIRYYVFVRKTLIEELLSCKGKEWTLPKFNEYIIKERFDYHHKTLRELQNCDHIGRNPFDEDMEKHMGEFI
jgi:hypothetical protein